LVRKHPGRTKTTHIKARLPQGTKGKKPFVGQDVTDWKAYVTACYEVGQTEWFIIEQEEYPDAQSSTEAARISLAGFKSILTAWGNSRGRQADENLAHQDSNAKAERDFAAPL
jgi:sugar phosphate isomerase/epimerase